MGETFTYVMFFFLVVLPMGIILFTMFGEKFANRRHLNKMLNDDDYRKKVESEIEQHKKKREEERQRRKKKDEDFPPF